MAMIPRSEYPDPMWERKNWINLNGTWQFEIDNGRNGIHKGYAEKDTLEGQITVPFCPESKLSGIGNTDYIMAVWYKKNVTLDKEFIKERTVLHIGACDYKTVVWVNGKCVGEHEGGYTPIALDITGAVVEGDNLITVYAEDDSRCMLQPKGKQSFRFASALCHYTRTTGIWQTVWLESTPKAYIDSARYNTELDGTVTVKAKAVNANGKKLCVKASFDGKTVCEEQTVVCGQDATVILKICEPKLWDTENPNLYDLELTMDGDTVNSYFGIRTVSCANRKFYLNGKEIYGRYILDQGFYPDGIYTAPTAEALENDIRMSIACGFNGARLHQKIFEPRFLYLCDKIGYIVWDEHANWGLDVSDVGAYRTFIPEWIEIMNRDINHPAIIGWCPFNETQRDQDPKLLSTVYDLTKAIDVTRPVIETSGWVHVKGKCDMVDAHDYEQDPAKFGESLDKKIADDAELCFVSEFGGTSWSAATSEGGWGYGSAVNSEDEFIERYAALIAEIYKRKEFCAFCYTQLTDVEQEQNGLYTYDRKPKFDVERICKATKGIK